ncbi:MAG: STN and carboxypeptidase regulatory-like domain-containing protein [Chryseosolibacter sp.]
MKRLIFFILFTCGSLGMLAQTPLLERKLSIAIKNERLDATLKRISGAGNFIFSYSPEILDEEKIINLTFVDRSVRQILDEIFKGSVQYKARGKYIILTQARQAAKQEPAIVTGYVVDEATGERLKDVSIYDPVTLTSTTTDSFGYFEMKIEKPSADLILSVNRANYSDTLVNVASKDRLLNIPIRIDREKVIVLADSVGQKVKRFWERQVLFFENMNLRNIDDTLYRRTQVSFVPFVGTNHKMSGHVINDYSLNILGGYSLGIRKLEFGGVFNLVRGNMNGVQFAGVLNGVGGEMTGVQFAGVFNGNRQASHGAQFAGVLNLNTGDTEGLLAAGVGNITAGRQEGPQLAGVYNIASHDAGPVQLGGVFNLAAKNMKGAQVAGVFNLTGKRIKGAQVAGVFNLAGKEIQGTQIAGVLNFASRVKGSQIGLINIADSIRGVPIGLMSIVWKGYHKIEISADEIFYTNLSFRTGVRQFYNILAAGVKPSTYKEDETFWTFGYGVGTAPRLSRKLFLNLDVTANQIVKGHTIDAINLLNKVYVGFDYQAFKKMSLTFGATLNGYITKNSVDTYPDLFTEYRPDIFYDRDFGTDHNLKMWIGGKVGLRFL